MQWDLIVIANPVWETARLVDQIPSDTPAGLGAPARFDPSIRTGQDLISDGGGSALNTACALAAAGRRVLAVGRVGDDEAGHACLEALRHYGVEPACAIAPGRTTKRNTCFVERGTQTTAFAVELPDRAVAPWEEDPPSLLDSRILLLDRLAAAAPGWLRARAEGGLPARVSATGDAVAVPIPVTALVRNSAIFSPAGRARFLAVMPHLGYLQIPESTNQTATEPAAGNDYTRIHRPRALPPLTGGEIQELLGAGVHLLVRTRGAEGAILHVYQRPAVSIPAVRTEVTDPTGAGDAFAAGFLDGLLAGLPPIQAAHRGANWAARACRYLGARAWIRHEPPRLLAT